jgi:nucleoid DNA-binding protein
MKYDKMTKEELIKKLEEQQHLASAVEAKDIEMSQLKNKKDEELKKLKESLLETRKELAQKAHMITKQQADEMVNTALKDAEKTVQIANEFLAANKNSLELMNAAIKIINHNDKLLNEKLK